jgi:hypothetical protein
MAAQDKARRSTLSTPERTNGRSLGMTMRQLMCLLALMLTGAAGCAHHVSQASLFARDGATCHASFDQARAHLAQSTAELVKDRGSPARVMLREPESDQAYTFKYSNVFVYSNQAVKLRSDGFAFKLSSYGIDARRNVIFWEESEKDDIDRMRLVSEAAPWAASLTWDAASTVTHSSPVQVLFAECDGLLISLRVICAQPQKSASSPGPVGLNQCRFQSLGVAALKSVKRTDAPSRTLPSLQNVLLTSSAAR